MGRLSYSDTNNNGSIAQSEIVEENNYYPFGLKHKGYNDVYSGGNASAQKYGFGGKELQDENINGSQLNWHDFGARNYDAALGRWMNLDPLADVMRSYSPYNFAFNNPLRFVDPSGLMPQDTKLSETDLDIRHKERVRISNEINADAKKSFDWLLDSNHPERVIIYNLQHRADNYYYKPSGIGLPVGARVLAPTTNWLGKVLNFITGNQVEYNGVFYDVDNEGRVIRLSPRMGLGPAEWIGGAKFIKGARYGLLNQKALNSLISTEKGAQSAEGISRYVQAMNEGKPIQAVITFTYKGKTYILGGHHRVKAALESRKRLDVIDISSKKASLLYKNKYEEIIKGLHK